MTMNLVEQKNDDSIYIEPLLVISRLAQLSVYPVGTIIHITDDGLKLVNIGNDEYSKYKVNEIIFTIEQLWEPIIDYTDWYKTCLSEKYKSDYTALTLRAIQGIQKIRDLTGSRVVIEAMLSRTIAVMSECCGIEISRDSKRSPYVGSLFGRDLCIPPDITLTPAHFEFEKDMKKRPIKRIDFKPLLLLLNQYDSKITESEEELVFIREAIDNWIRSTSI